MRSHGRGQLQQVFNRLRGLFKHGGTAHRSRKEPVPQHLIGLRIGHSDQLLPTSGAPSGEIALDGLFSRCSSWETEQIHLENDARLALNL